VFRFVSERGIPLDVIVSRLDDEGFMVDWLDFYREAMKENWPSERTLGRLREVVGDVYGPEWAEKWLQRFREVLKTAE
jgi:hypothetical protein